MGSYLITYLIPIWTIFFGVLVRMLLADKSLFQDLGLNPLPDITKINISQDEYTRMMEIYLNNQKQPVPKLVTYYLETKDWWRRRNDATRLKFPLINENYEDIESGTLRILAPPYNKTELKIKIYQIFGKRHHHKRLIDEKLIYLSKNLTKWCEFDITNILMSFYKGERNLGLDIVCLNCNINFKPLKVAINFIVLKNSSRLKRSLEFDRKRTQCKENSKKKCCRHKMEVKFDELKFPEMGTIIQPKSYEAGFCQGQCPPNYNHATNHSRIQSLIHQMDRKNSKRLKKKITIPKACCAPSKLEPLEILRVNPLDATKLIVEKWDNMKVAECACS